MPNTDTPNSAHDLDAALKQHDALIVQCITGKLSFEQFLDAYDSFYWCHALDGHEADSAGLQLLASRRGRIEVHRLVAEEVLARLASESDAARAEYRQAGRIGPAEALVQIKKLASLHGLTGAAI